jgi:hypothetical protein
MAELENAPKAKFDQYGAMVSMPEPTDKMVDLNSKMKQTTLTDHLAKAANVDRTKVYFDDVDLVWGSKTVKQGALIDKEYTFADAVDELKSFADANPKAEGQVNELEPDAEPIDAPIEPPVDHAPIVQSFLTDPDKKLVLRKDDSADKMLTVTKFKDKNTMLSSILSDIASRLLTKSGEEDRVANFASRVADEMEQEKSATFKPTPDYMKNKKIAIQLAKRYIDDYKKIQKDPGYEKEVRMEPGAFAPKKDLKGKAKEQEAFEGWVDSVGEATIKPYVSMYRDDKDGKMIYDVLDKDSKSAFKSKDLDAAQEYLSKNYNKLREVEHQAKDPELEKKDKENSMKLDVTKADKAMNTLAFKRMQAGDDRYVDKTDEQMSDKAIDKFHKELDNVVHKHIGHSSDEKKEKEEMKKEGNEFALAVRKAKAAGMKAGDKFKVGDKEYTLKDAIELAGLQLEEFFSEEEIAYDNQIDRIKNLAFYQ